MSTSIEADVLAILLVYSTQVCVMQQSTIFPGDVRAKLLEGQTREDLHLQA